MLWAMVAMASQWVWLRHQEDPWNGARDRDKVPCDSVLCPGLTLDGAVVNPE